MSIWIPFHQRAWQDDPEPPEQGEPEAAEELGEEFEQWLEDDDRRYSDLYDTANGDIGDEALPPF
jgi:hypothetical protein